MNILKRISSLPKVKFHLGLIVKCTLMNFGLKHNEAEIITFVSYCQLTVTLLQPIKLYAYIKYHIVHHKN